MNDKLQQLLYLRWEYTQQPDVRIRPVVSVPTLGVQILGANLPVVGSTLQEALPILDVPLIIQAQDLPILVDLHAGFEGTCSEFLTRMHSTTTSILPLFEAHYSAGYTAWYDSPNLQLMEMLHRLRVNTVESGITNGFTKMRVFVDLTHGRDPMSISNALMQSVFKSIITEHEILLRDFTGKIAACSADDIVGKRN